MCAQLRVLARVSRVKTKNKNSVMVARETMEHQRVFSHNTFWNPDYKKGKLRPLRIKCKIGDGHKSGKWSSGSLSAIYLWAIIRAVNHRLP